MHAKIQIRHSFPLRPSPSPQYIHLNGSMAVRLIRTIIVRRLNIWCWDRERALVVVNTTLLARVVSILHTLIGTSGDELLSIVASARATAGILLVLGGAAADSEHPEETSSDAERGCEPGGSEKRGVEGRLDTVCLGGRFDGSDGDGTHDSSHDRGDNDRYSRETRYDVGNAGSRARAEAEEANDKLENAG